MRVWFIKSGFGYKSLQSGPISSIRVFEAYYRSPGAHSFVLKASQPSGIFPGLRLLR